MILNYLFSFGIVFYAVGAIILGDPKWFEVCFWIAVLWACTKIFISPLGANPPGR